MTRSFTTHICKTFYFLKPHFVRHDSFTCVTWCIHMCDMTHIFIAHIRKIFYFPHPFSPFCFEPHSFSHTASQSRDLSLLPSPTQKGPSVLISSLPPRPTYNWGTQYGALRVCVCLWQTLWVCVYMRTCVCVRVCARSDFQILQWFKRDVAVIPPDTLRNAKKLRGPLEWGCQN